jgi:acetyl-CoA carboxylase biotin carboxyl carrier protein
MKIEELRQVVHWLEDAHIGELEVERDDGRVRIVLQERAAGSPEIDDDGERAIVAAEMPGLFLVRHPQHAGPMVAPGAAVRAGDVVALIQIGSIYAPVTASTDGTLAKILTVPQTLVGFGTPLFEIASAVTPSVARGL